MVPRNEVQLTGPDTIPIPALVEVLDDGAGKIQATAPTEVQAKVKDQLENLDEDKVPRKRRAAEGGGSVSMRSPLKKWKGSNEAEKKS